MTEFKHASKARDPLFVAWWQKRCANMTVNGLRFRECSLGTQEFIERLAWEAWEECTTIITAAVKRALGV